MIDCITSLSLGLVVLVLFVLGVLVVQLFALLLVFLGYFLFVVGLFLLQGHLVAVLV